MSQQVSRLSLVVSQSKYSQCLVEPEPVKSEAAGYSVQVCFYDLNSYHFTTFGYTYLPIIFPYISIIGKNKQKTVILYYLLPVAIIFCWNIVGSLGSTNVWWCKP